jgi:hypothetical protein
MDSRDSRVKIKDIQLKVYNKTKKNKDKAWLFIW